MRRDGGRGWRLFCLEGKMTYLGEGFLWGTGGRGAGGNYAHKKWPKVSETRLSSSNSRTYWNQICVCLKHNFKEKLPLLQIISFGERNIEIGKCMSKVKSVIVIPVPTNINRTEPYLDDDDDDDDDDDEELFLWYDWPAKYV